jgi:hypothetical protein
MITINCRKKVVCLQLGCLGILTAVVFFSVPLEAGFGWFDAGRHAMNGVFYHDMLRDIGFLNPIAYTLDYYQHYPAIAPVIYPPFFSLCQALFFAILGLHAWVSRLTVALFLWIGAWGTMRLSSYIFGEKPAFYSGILYICLPLVLYWGRDVMLEVPAMALVIWSFCFFLLYLEKKTTGSILLCFLLATLAIYTKQNTIFLLPTLILTAVFSNKVRSITSLRFISGFLLCAISGIPLAYITFKWGSFNLRQAIGNLEIYSMGLGESIIFYIKKLPDTVGWAILLLSCLGIIYLIQQIRDKSFTKPFQAGISLIVSWSVLCYGQMVLVKIKDPRHSFFLLPVFALLAGAGVVLCATKISNPKQRLVLPFIFLTALFGLNLTRCQNNWSTGFEKPALYLKEHWEGTALLIDVHKNAHLAFHFRAIDPERKFRIYRSDKIFESMFVYKFWGVESFIENKQQFLQELKNYGIRYVLLENKVSLPTDVQKLLRVAVADNQIFEKIQEFPLHLAGHAGYKENTLSLYRYKGEISDPGAIPVMHIPIIGAKISEGSLIQTE